MRDRAARRTRTAPRRTTPTARRVWNGDCVSASRDGFEFAIKSKREVHAGTQDVPLRSAPPRGTDPLRPRWSQREDSQEDSRPGFMGMLFSCALCSQQPPQVTQRRAHACSRDRRAPSRMLPLPSGRPRRRPCPRAGLTRPPRRRSPESRGASRRRPWRPRARGWRPRGARSQRAAAGTLKGRRRPGPHRMS